jgi:cytochrome c oxidase subunit 1
MMIEAAIGGIILGISGLLFFGNMLGTVLHKKRVTTPVEMPVAEPMEPEPIPSWLDTWRPWVVTTIVLILIAYGPVLINLISNINLTSPGFTIR